MKASTIAICSLSFLIACFVLTNYKKFKSADHTPTQTTGVAEGAKQFEGQLSVGMDTHQKFTPPTVRSNASPDVRPELVRRQQAGNNK